MTRERADPPRIRRATPADTEALVALMRDFHAESAMSLDRDWAAASFAALFADPALGCVWIANMGSQHAGHAVLTLRHSMEYGGLAGCIDDLFVRPQFRRRKLGSGLLEALFDECRARQCRSVHVEVGPENAAAIALYGTRGLAPCAGDRLLLAAPLTDS
jgi:ribosomal protein S18 acetylase RimI-like enzyme